MDAIVLTPDQYKSLKDELRNELLRELQPVVHHTPAYYYNVCRELVFKRFARKDKGHTVNYEVAKAFSCMIRDAFLVDRVYDLTPEQGEHAIAMTREIIEVVDKYVRK
ncbi:hypothetical protein D3C74_158430 [compost metagenome]